MNFYKSLSRDFRISQSGFYFIGSFKIATILILNVCLPRVSLECLLEELLFLGGPGLGAEPHGLRRGLSPDTRNMLNKKYAITYFF